MLENSSEAASESRFNIARRLFGVQFTRAPGDALIVPERIRSLILRLFSLLKYLNRLEANQKATELVHPV